MEQYLQDQVDGLFETEEDIHLTQDQLEYFNFTQEEL